MHIKNHFVISHKSNYKKNLIELVNQSDYKNLEIEKLIKKENNEERDVVLITFVTVLIKSTAFTRSNGRNRHTKIYKEIRCTSWVGVPRRCNLESRLIGTL